MVSKEYLNIVSEFYDLSDPYTLQKVVMCNEAQKETNIENLTVRLYNDIRNGVDQIDFGTIPLSKGNITKIDGYENLVQCIDTLSSLIKEYGQSTELIDVISTGLENIQSRTRTWEKAFALNIDIPMVFYNTMTLAVVSSVTLLITTCIEYIKNGNNTISIAFDKGAYIKKKEHVLFVSLRSFNKACATKEIDKAMADCIKANAVRLKEAYESNNGEIIEELTLSDMSKFASDLKNTDSDLIKNKINPAFNIGFKIVGIYTAVRLLLYIIKNMSYWLMNMRQSVSDYLIVQANFLQTNAENLERRDRFKDNDEKRKKIYDKQMKWVDRFKRWANAFMIKDKKAEAEAKRREQEDNKKKKYEDDDEDDGGIF